VLFRDLVPSPEYRSASLHLIERWLNELHYLLPTSTSLVAVVVQIGPKQRSPELPEYLFSRGRHLEPLGDALPQHVTSHVEIDDARDVSHRALPLIADIPNPYAGSTARLTRYQRADQIVCEDLLDTPGQLQLRRHRESLIPKNRKETRRQRCGEKALALLSQSFPLFLRQLGPLRFDLRMAETSTGEQGVEPGNGRLPGIGIEVVEVRDSIGSLHLSLLRVHRVADLEVHRRRDVRHRDVARGVGAKPQTRLRRDDRHDGRNGKNRPEQVVAQQIPPPGSQSSSQTSL